MRRFCNIRPLAVRRTGSLADLIPSRLVGILAVVIFAAPLVPAMGQVNGAVSAANTTAKANPPHGSGRVRTILHDNFSVDNLTGPPRWTPTARKVFSVVTATTPQGTSGHVVQQSGAGKTHFATLDTPLPFGPETKVLQITVQFRYPSGGASFSQWIVGLGTTVQGKDYSFRVADAAGGFGRDKNAALFKNGVNVPLAIGDTHVPYDNKWHTLKLSWARANHLLQAYFDSKRILSVHDGTYTSFTHVYVGGVTLAGKDVQFDDVVVRGTIPVSTSQPSRAVKAGVRSAGLSSSERRHYPFRPNISPCRHPALTGVIKGVEHEPY